MSDWQTAAEMIVGVFFWSIGWVWGYFQYRETNRQQERANRAQEQIDEYIRDAYKANVAFISAANNIARLETTIRVMKAKQFRHHGERGRFIKAPTAIPDPCRDSQQTEGM
jgi:hypothetical protein